MAQRAISVPAKLQFQEASCPYLNPFSDIGLFKLSDLLLGSAMGDNSEDISELAVPYAAIGQVSKALVLANQITEPSWKVTTLIDIAKHQPTVERRKTLEQATKIVESEQSLKSYRVTLLKRIAVEYAVLRELPKALQLVQPLSENLDFFVDTVRRQVKDREDKMAIELVIQLPKYLSKNRHEVQLAMLESMLNRSVQDNRSKELLPQVLTASDDCIRRDLVSNIVISLSLPTYG